MDSPITRRDFLNGVALGIGGTTRGGMAFAGSRNPPRPGPGRAYPPALTGIARIARRIVRSVPLDARRRVLEERAAQPQDTGEEYDLVVVGGGISGLTAAHVFRKARPDARVLVLDNHDDFGGHAKRNEFTHNGRTYIGYGGTQSIDSPAPYSQVAKDLISELGIDVAALLQGARLRTSTSRSASPGVLLRQGNLRNRSPAGRRHPRRSVSGRGAGERRGAARPQAAARPSTSTRCRASASPRRKRASRA